MQLERSRERRAGELGTIVLLTKMGGDEMLEPRGVDSAEETRRSAVVEMPEPACDASLERLGVVAVGDVAQRVLDAGQLVLLDLVVEQMPAQIADRHGLVQLKQANVTPPLRCTPSRSNS